MDANLLERLSEITPEEQRILDGHTQIEKNIYTSSKDFTVDSKKMLERTSLISIRNHTRFVHFPQHRHNYVEIMYICQGSITNIIDGKEIIVKQGELLFLDQHIKHEIMPARKTDICINFIIRPEFFDIAFSMIGRNNILSDFLENMLRQDSREGQYLYFKVSQVLPIQNLIENMIHSLIYKQGNEDVINQTTMGLIFLHLLNAAKYMETSTPNRYDDMIIFTTLKYIDNNYKTASLSELCDILNQSISSLSRLIKSNTGHNFKELLQRKRFKKAIELLCDTKLSVNDIILAVGYENNSYFHRRFKERYHMTPKEFRMQNQDNDKIHL